MLAVNERLFAVYLSGLESDRWRVRRKSAHGLSTLGSVGARAIPALKRAAEQDFDLRVRQAAAEALERLGAEEAE
jgi:HEAT repeat protein